MALRVAGKTGEVVSEAKWRDRIAAAICNWTMRHVASEHYRKMIGGSVSYSMASALRDDLEGREPPAPLWEAAVKAAAEGRLGPLPRKPTLRPESVYVNERGFPGSWEDERRG